MVVCPEARATVVETPAVVGEPIEAAGRGGGMAQVVLVAVMAAWAAVSVLILRAMGLLRRGSLARARRDVSHLSWMEWLGLAVGLHVVSLMGAAAAVQLGLSTGGLATDDAVAQGLVWMLGHYVVGLGVVVGVRVWDAKPFAAAGFSIRRRDILIGLLGLAAVWPLILLTTMAGAALSTWLSGEAPNRLAHETLRTILDDPGSPIAWLLIAGVVIGAPILEEVMYRGLLQTAFVRFLRKPVLAILATSVLFAGQHVGSADPHAIAGLFVFSIALGFAFERSGRLGPSIVMHAGFNAANVILALFVAAGT